MTADELGSAGPAKCLVQECSNRSAPVTKRGLCLLCYSKAKRMVEAGTTTWQEIVDFGLALPGDEAGADPFTRALRQVQKRAKKHREGGTDAATTGAP